MIPEPQDQPPAPERRALRTAGLFLLGMLAGPTVLGLWSLLPIGGYSGSDLASWWEWGGILLAPLGLLYGPLFTTLIDRWVRTAPESAATLPRNAAPFLPFRGRWARYFLAPVLFTAAHGVLFGLLHVGAVVGGGTSLLAASLVLWFFLLVFTAIYCSRCASSNRNG